MDMFDEMKIVIPGVLQHEYVDASDDMAAYQADQCKRQGVTAQWAWDNLCDETLYVYRENESAGTGIDPWLVIDGGMDQLKANGHFVLCFGKTGEIVVDPHYRVFASKSVVNRVLGIVTTEGC